MYRTGSFDRSIFTFEMKRKSGYFALTVILPCLLIGAIEAVTFAIPFNKTVRLELSFTCLLAYSVFQTMVTNQLPRSSDRPPLLLLLISIFIVYIAISICIQGCNIWLYTKATKRHPVSPCLLKMAQGIASFCCISPLLTSVDPFANDNDDDSTFKSSLSGPIGDEDSNRLRQRLSVAIGRSNKQSWILIASVIDRIGLILYLLLLSFTCLIFLVVIPLSFNHSLD